MDNAENKENKKKSRWWIYVILAIVIIIILLLLRSCGGSQSGYVDLPTIGDVTVSDQQQTRPTENIVQEDIPTITFSGTVSAKVNKDNPAVEVNNPEGNFVDMVFTLTDQATEEVIARTGKVGAGKYAYVNVMDFYQEPGTYMILINVATYDAETGAQQNGINQKMEITVE